MPLRTAPDSYKNRNHKILSTTYVNDSFHSSVRKDEMRLFKILRTPGLEAHSFHFHHPPQLLAVSNLQQFSCLSICEYAGAKKCVLLISIWFSLATEKALLLYGGRRAGS